MNVFEDGFGVELWTEIADFAGVRYLDRSVSRGAVEGLLEQVKPLMKFEGVTFLEVDKVEEALASLSVSLWGSLSDSLSISLSVSLRDSLSDYLSVSLRDSLYDSLSASLRVSLSDYLSVSLRESLEDSLKVSLSASMWDSLRGSLFDSLWDSLRDYLVDSLWLSVLYYCGFRLVKDEVRTGQLKALLDVWRLGACPLGTLQDGSLLVVVKSLKGEAEVKVVPPLLNSRIAGAITPDD